MKNVQITRDKMLDMFLVQYEVTKDGVDEPVSHIMPFVELISLYETFKEAVSEEESRILQEELSGDFACDGCTI